MDLSGTVSPFFSVSEAQPSVLLMFIGSVPETGDGKGCLGVSQDTPSVWGRGSCQPDYPLPASLRSLWLRFKQNTQLKQKEREGTSARMMAPVPNCIIEAVNSVTHHTRGLCDFVFMVWFENTHICMCTHTHTTHFFSLTHNFSLSWNTETITPSCRKSYSWKLEWLLRISQVLW